MSLSKMQCAPPILVVIVSAALAQGLTKEQKIERILELTRSDAVLEQTFEQMRTFSSQTASQAGQGPSKEQVAIASDLMNKVFDLVRKRTSLAEARPRLVKIYNETYSDEEIDGMLAFYQSPAGRAVIQKGPRLMANLEAQIKELLPEINRLLQEARLTQTTAPRSSLLGKMTPDFTLTDVSGKEIHLSDFRGKAVVLEFWATWCEPCRAELPVLQKLHADHPEVAVLGINVGENQDVVLKFATQSQISYPILMGHREKVLDDYDARALPTVVVIGTDGKILRHIVGYGPQVEEQLRSALGSAVGSPTASPITTKAIEPWLAGWLGTWVNSDPATSGITRMELTAAQPGLAVHAWGRCHPQDCDWGTSPGRLIDGIFRVRWDPHFAFVDQELKMISAGRLRLSTRTYFREPLRKDYTMVEDFVRK